MEGNVINRTHPIPRITKKVIPRNAFHINQLSILILHFGVYYRYNERKVNG